MAERDADIVARMEPMVHGSPPHVAAPISIAISLKRIADFICGGRDHEGTDRMDVVAYIGREIQDVIQGR